MNENSSTEEKAFKVVMIGEMLVGKTSLVSALKDVEFSSDYLPTIGVSFSKFNTKINGKDIQIQIWDTAGQEKYKALGPLYYRGAHAAIIVFDVTNRESFTNISSWITNFYSQVDNNSLIFIAGNKTDLSDEAEVTSDEAQSFADYNQAVFIETSAKRNYNVKLLFNSVAEALYNKKVAQVESVNLDSQGKKPCC